MLAPLPFTRFRFPFLTQDLNGERGTGNGKPESGSKLPHSRMNRGLVDLQFGTKIVYGSAQTVVEIYFGSPVQ
jgi:hypothetical protein